MCPRHTGKLMKRSPAVFEGRTPKITRRSRSLGSHKSHQKRGRICANLVTHPVWFFFLARISTRLNRTLQLIVRWTYPTPFTRDRHCIGIPTPTCFVFRTRLARDKNASRPPFLRGLPRCAYELPETEKRGPSPEASAGSWGRGVRAWASSEKKKENPNQGFPPSNFHFQAFHFDSSPSENASSAVLQFVFFFTFRRYPYSSAVAL